MMMEVLARWSLIVLCCAFGAALGGGLYESIVLVPLWSKSPPASFAIIQPGTGVPLQYFWIPVHVAITLFMLAAIALMWRDRRVRRWLLAGAASYVVMRTWSALFFIPEMSAFQQIPSDVPPSPELDTRVASWIFWTVFREPLDVFSLVCALLALHWFKRDPHD
jgi:hypothetical protein